MNLKTRLTLLGLILVMPLASFGQAPPPNDNYSNSITLTGTDVTFAGSLAGSTLEDRVEQYTFENLLADEPFGSVWWNWTAPTDTILTLQVLSYSSGPTNSQTGQNEIIVYAATNGSTTPDGLIFPVADYLPLYLEYAPLTRAIPVTAGTFYQIQFIGSSPATCTIRLIATNAPVVVQQPRSQTVSSNESTVLYVIRAGTNQSAFSYQWRFNGTNLAGETAQMLALTNIDGSMAGAYTVVVSNSAGFTISDPAILTVSQSNYPVTLAALGTTSTSFVFSVTGELGRNYALQSSTNLVNWAAEKGFALDPYSAADITSVFYETNSPLTLTVTNAGVQKFFRVSPYVIGRPEAEICINHLRQIRIAKSLWRRDMNYSTEATPTTFEMAPYLPGQTLPTCPDDPMQWYYFSYVTLNVRTVPMCLINPILHVLVDPL